MLGGKCSGGAEGARMKEGQQFSVTVNALASYHIPFSFTHLFQHQHVQNVYINARYALQQPYSHLMNAPRVRALTFAARVANVRMTYTSPADTVLHLPYQPNSSLSRRATQGLAQCLCEFLVEGFYINAWHAYLESPYKTSVVLGETMSTSSIDASI
jgi:hypothetical protein